MKFANKVNGLIVGFKGIDFDEVNNLEMLVMERLLPFDYRGFEVEKRELFFDVLYF